MARTKVDLSTAYRQVREFKVRATRSVADEIKTEIVRNLNAGVSPVQGGGRLDKYSPSYTDDIRSGKYTGKSRSPVNLKLTGALHKSIFSIIQGDRIIVGFKNKLADIHNRLGAGKAKTVRRMLPTNKGEKFNRSIQLTLREVLGKIANSIFR